MYNRKKKELPPTAVTVAQLSKKTKITAKTASLEAF